jgi:DNA-binding transcriptional regulator YdaS (Cro superfamily)
MKLDEWMALHGYNDQRMAALIGVNQSNVSRIRNGSQKPSARTLARMEEVTSGAVSAKDFFPKGN